MDADQEHEPDLPDLPPPSSVPANFRRPKPPVFTSLPSQDSFAGSSSDPPVFSSDDVPPGSENYAAQRKKKSRVGPWWESSQPRKKRKAEPLGRNFDSGVFMDRDPEISSSDAFSSDFDVPEQQIGENMPATKLASADPPTLAAAPLPDEYTRWGPPRDLVNSFYYQPDRTLPTPISSFPDAVSESPDLNRTLLCEDDSYGRRKSPRALRPPSRGRFKLRLSRPTPEAYAPGPALEVVESAVENGVEDIDLTGRLVWQEEGRLSDSPHLVDDSIFHPLHHLVKTRAVHDPDRYDSLVPDMRLWLSHNNLERLPNEIYRLRNLTKLGLRGNSLKSLAPTISRLDRLQYLNLRNNNVHFLPWEITLLPNLNELFVDANFLYTPMASSKALEKAREACQTFRVGLGSTIAISAVSWLDTSGMPIQHSPPRPCMTHNFDPVSSEHLESPAESTSSRVPSMSDMCLRTAVSCPDLPALLTGKQAAALPPHLIALLKQALDTELAGGTRCSVCSRPFVVPRAEWIEWIYRVRVKESLPLLRSACSWGCVTAHMSTIYDIVDPVSKKRLEPDVLPIRGCGWELVTIKKEDKSGGPAGELGRRRGGRGEEGR